jgi:hypothetical protein
MQETLRQGQEDSDLDRQFLVRPWGCVALALLEYRRGGWKTSRLWCEKELTYAPSKPRDAMAWLLMAMNSHQFGEHDSAQSYLQRASVLTDDAYPRRIRYSLPASGGELQWFDWEFASILRDEARTLLDGAQSE